jgi:hypothetical protein
MRQFFFSRNGVMQTVKNIEMPSEIEIIKTLHSGPKNGRQIYNILTDNSVPRLDDAFDELVMELWGLCKSSSKILTKSIGTHYLRIEKRLEGDDRFRMSPSIPREFMDYTVLALSETELDIRFKELENELEKTNRWKLEVVDSAVRRIIKEADNPELLKRACFVVAGDVALGMTNALLRECDSIGELVQGSDLDIVIIFETGFEEMAIAIDEVLYKIKWELLKGPEKEELDYKVKDLDDVKKQAEMSSSEDIIATKVIDESLFLHGNKEVYDSAQKIIESCGAKDKLLRFKEIARSNRVSEEKRFRDILPD